MNSSPSPTNAIIKYYQECNNAYRDAWGLDKNMQLNLGLWRKDTSSLKEALINLNKEVALKLKVNSSFNILDAGCGVGGSAIYLAKKFGCKVVGISLVAEQIEQAKKNAVAEKVEHLATFKVMDYHHTSFKNDSFDAIIGIESICYADPKVDFLAEAFRLLKKGGSLVLAENLQGKETLTAAEIKSLYTNAFNGCQVKSLDTQQQYLKNLKLVGFSTASCEDYTTLIRPSIKRLRRFYYPAAAYNFVHRIIGRRFSKIQEANTRMCYHLLSSLDSGLWKYGIIKAKK